MKKIICLFILSLILLTSCSKKEVISSYDKIIERDVLIVGVKTDSKPFGFINPKTGQNEGFDIDIAKSAALEILGNERKIQFVPVNPNTRIEAVTSGEVDMVIATMSITPQREYFVDFSQPYYIAGQSAIVKKDSSINTFADLKHKTTIVVLGSTAEENLRRIIPTAKIIGYTNYKDAFQALKEGKADALSTDNAILTGFILDNKGYRILKNKISREPYAIAIKRDDNNEKLKKTLDMLITRMNRDGSMTDLKKKWHLI
ncbi:MAG: transporter substrate-binding domain-containing protein [Candidatus Gastranaerophilales bacterium]|nr:transporter substrate-binding domain-containing protein [Candidatus Gastranaerophilales bacterium]